MEQIVVKLEEQNNGEILLYYVDENGDNQEGVLTTIENIENTSIQLQDNYILGNLDEMVEEPLSTVEEQPSTQEWADDEIKRLLTFYTDNMPSFVSGLTQKKHLWTVACKTMLIGKTQEACEEKLEELKTKYCEIRSLILKGMFCNEWPYFDMCHTAFHNDKAVVAMLAKETAKSVSVLNQEAKENDTVTVTRHVYTKTQDPNVTQMLNLYLKYKSKFQKEYWRRDLWDTIAKEMGESDGEYLQKRFLNYKQHYIQMLEKRNEGSKINWPYIDLFDQIFKDDVQFHKKYFNTVPQIKTEDTENKWDRTQITVLAKYYYESYDEFGDPTIPKKFLWTEIGRLIDKSPDSCKAKYIQMREEHIAKYITGQYSIEKRLPVEIIYDYIISKDVKKELHTDHNVTFIWKTAHIDQLVKFIYEIGPLYKDPICHFVCWAAVAKKTSRTVLNCKRQWSELLSLYSSILTEKKNNADMEIDWRYMEMFDQIFNYGMDSKLLEGFDEKVIEIDSEVSEKVAVKKLKLEDDTDKDNTSETEDAEPRTDPRSTKILDFYFKYKDKFQLQKNKISLWDPLSVEIDMSSTQCAHRLRYLKQTYIENVQKEIAQPSIAITWPYYLLCKKVFGYRTIKNKLKQGQINDDWMAREIKQLISYFSKNFEAINNSDDLKIWQPLASELRKSTRKCKEKFVELRKCYRKLKTMRSRNPEVKISWSYFNMFERIYSLKESQMEVATVGESQMEGIENAEEDDYQCIIVLPEGQDLTDIHNAQILLKNNKDGTITIPQHTTQTKWTRRTKKLLLINYINYIRMNRGKEIDSNEMWKKISSKINNKPPNSCRKMFTKMINAFEKANETTKQNSPFTMLLNKVMKLKPKFTKTDTNKPNNDSFKNVELSHEKVKMALVYYLEHIDEFLNPQFEKKYLWNQLANYISEPVNKVFNKINFLKQSVNSNTEDNSPENLEYNQILKEIIAKEATLRELEVKIDQKYPDQTNEWSDDETDTLLNWYLINLDKFKNAKFDRSYLWLEASTILQKSPLVCSKKMSELRTLYKNMVKQNSPALENWKFLTLCQQIYGTGKK